MLPPAGGRSPCRCRSPDAERRLAEVVDLNEHDGGLLQIRNDPRIRSLALDISILLRTVTTVIAGRGAY